MGSCFLSSSHPVGDLIYFPTMAGVVYVLKWNKEIVDEVAIASISELGRTGETRSLSSLAYKDGKIIARNIKELLCKGR